MNDMNWIKKKETAHNYSEYLRKGFNWNYFLTIRTPYKIYTKTPLTWSYRILENHKDLLLIFQKPYNNFYLNENFQSFKA